MWTSGIQSLTCDDASSRRLVRNSIVIELFIYSFYYFTCNCSKSERADNPEAWNNEEKTEEET